MKKDDTSFEIFKSNVCHKLKRLGDINFLIDILQSRDIRKYYESQHFLEALYLLAMVDYLSRINDIPLCSDFDDLRRLKFQEPIFSESIIAASIVTKDDSWKKEAIQNAIPEFIRFNIVEGDIRDVV